MIKLDNNQTECVFIIDDDIGSLHALTEQLKELKLLVVPLRRGEELLNLISKRLPDLILLDINLKDNMDGFLLCRKLKTIESVCNVPVIFISAYTDIANKIKAFTAGGIDYINKPVQKEELWARVKVHLELASVKKQLKEKNNKLQNEVSERKKIESELETQRSKLAETVSDRTDELMDRNLELQEEVIKREKADLTIQQQLQELQQSRQELLKSLEKEKQIQQSLKSSQNQLAMAIDVSKAGIYEHRIPIGPELYHSENWARIIGYDLKELPPYDRFIDWLKSITHPDDWQELDKQYSDFIEGRSQEYHTEIRLKHKDGRWVYVQGDAKALERDKRGWVTHLIGTMTDITAKKKVEDELRKHRDHLEELVIERTLKLQAEIEDRKRAEQNVACLKKRLEFILGATKTGLDIIDSDFNVIYIDPEWQRLYGAFAGKKCYEYFKDFSEPCISCGIHQAKKLKKTVITEQLLPKENNRPVQVTTIPYQENEGRWLFAEVKADITERKHVEDKLEQQKQQLAKNLEELETFNKAMLDREMRIIEMKKEVNQLYHEQGKTPKYPPVWE